MQNDYFVFKGLKFQIIKRIIKRLGLWILPGLIIMQFFRPEKNNRGYDGFKNFEKDTKVSAEIESILKKNCINCHSNQTRYPWYAEISPLSYWLNNHINQGKEHFNISEWDIYSIKKRDEIMDNLIDQVEERNMPLNYYTWIHGNLSEKDKEILLQWAAMVRLQYKNSLKVSSN